MWATRSGRTRDERGSAAAELVIATPLLLLLILCVVQFAIWEHATHLAEAVAQEGLATARLQGSSAQAGEGEAESVLAELGSSVLTNPAIAATRTATTTTVTVTGSAESIAGLFTLPVTATASGPTEAYTASGLAP